MKILGIDSIGTAAQGRLDNRGVPEGEPVTAAARNGATTDLRITDENYLHLHYGIVVSPRGIEREKP
ncbi:MAG: hypothetical protein ACYDB1_11420, partial [Acidiferrobacteraceae bacterium]